MNKDLNENVYEEFNINSEHRIRDIILLDDDILMFFESLPGFAILSSTISN